MRQQIKVLRAKCSLLPGNEQKTLHPFLQLKLNNQECEGGVCSDLTFLSECRNSSSALIVRSAIQRGDGKAFSRVSTSSLWQYFEFLSRDPYLDKLELFLQSKDVGLRLRCSPKGSTLSFRDSLATRSEGVKFRCTTSCWESTSRSGSISRPRSRASTAPRSWWRWSGWHIKQQRNLTALVAQIKLAMVEWEGQEPRATAHFNEHIEELEAKRRVEEANADKLYGNIASVDDEDSEWALLVDLSKDSATVATGHKLPIPPIVDDDGAPDLEEAPVQHETEKDKEA
eukprot:750985-Hanusia_phi.AAC.1